MPFRTSVPIREFAPGLESILPHVKEAKIIEGEGDMSESDSHRVFTWVVSYGPNSNIALFLYSAHDVVQGKDIADILEYSRKKTHSASEEDLQRIGMRPANCHPFPDIQLIREGGISALIMDETLYRLEEPCNFPIYSPTERVASAEMIPATYINAMRIVTGNSERIKVDRFTEDIHDVF